MKDRQANYRIVTHGASLVGSHTPVLVIEDVGPWDQYMTVTNAAAEVVEELFKSGELREGERLFYYDSEGSLDEIAIKDKRFAGFKPGPARRKEERS